MKKQKLKLSNLKKKKTVPPKPTIIPLEQGETEVWNYRQSFLYDFTAGLKAFYIPHEEINEFFLAYAGQGVGVRAYLGMSENTDFPYEPGDLKLIFVATAIDPKTGDRKDQIFEGRYVFDLSQPCPYECDATSPLFDPPPPITTKKRK